MIPYQRISQGIQFDVFFRNQISLSLDDMKLHRDAKASNRRINIFTGHNDVSLAAGRLLIWKLG